MIRYWLPLFCVSALLVVPQGAALAQAAPADHTPTFHAKPLPKLTYDPKLATRPGADLALQLQQLNERIDAFNQQIKDEVEADVALAFVSQLIGYLLVDARFYPPLQASAIAISSLYSQEMRGRDGTYWSNIASPWWQAFPQTLNHTQLPGYTVLWLQANNDSPQDLDLRTMAEPMCLVTLDGRRMKALDTKELQQRGIDKASIHDGIDSPFDYWPPARVAAHDAVKFGLVFPGVIERREVGRITGQYGVSTPAGTNSVTPFMIPFWENL